MTNREMLEWYYGNFGLHGVASICRYRLFGRPRIMRTHVAGSRYPVHLRLRTTDPSIYSEIFVKKQYDFDLPFVPSTIVDAGANIGMTSVYFANKYPQARIISIEAEASNYAMLAKNVAPYPQITPMHAALWNHDGMICVSKPDPKTGAFGEWGFYTHEGADACGDADAINVRAITMQTLMREMHLPSIDLLKMDIEGAEKEVFESADWTDSIGYMMIEIHDRFKPGCSAAVSAACKGFSATERGELTIYQRESHA